MTIWGKFVNIKDYRAEKVKKSEKKCCLFSTVTETFLHRLRVAWCGSKPLYSKKGIIRVYKIFFISRCGSQTDHHISDFQGKR
jgi:hypothetical protein